MGHRLTTTVLGSVSLAVALCLGCRGSQQPTLAPSWPGGETIQPFSFPKLAERTGIASEQSPAPVQPAIAVEAAGPVKRPRIEQLKNRLDAVMPQRRSRRPYVTQAGFGDGGPEIVETPDPYPLALPPPESPVSDTFIETDVRQAVQSLATQAGVSVIVDDEVRGVTTATIDDEPLNDAFRKVLLPLGYVHRRVDGVYYVGIANADSALFDWIADRYRYTALHRSPEELVGLLSKRHQPFVRIAPHGGWLMVEAPADQAERILAELEQVDRPVPQVVLEALICVYSPQTSFRFGFDVDAGVQVYDQATQIALSGLSLASTVGVQNTAANLNDFNVTSSLLRMLEQEGYVKIHAAPRVMALDGEKARIHIGRETFFSVQPESANGFVFRQDIQQVESGIMLEITPAIRDPYVTVNIDRAEVSEDIRSDETQANPSDRFPVINRRSVSTTVKVCDGETIVIGGLTQRQKIDLLNKVPVLGDLPIAGKLFQRIEKINSKVEVAIFISPRILKEECDEISCKDETALAYPSRSAGR